MTVLTENWVFPNFSFFSYIGFENNKKDDEKTKLTEYQVLFLKSTFVVLQNPDSSSLSFLISKHVILDGINQTNTERIIIKFYKLKVLRG